MGGHESQLNLLSANEFLKNSKSKPSHLNINEANTM